MSLHKDPTHNHPALVKALSEHGFATDRPSQVADAFRLGWAAATAAMQPTPQEKRDPKPLTLKDYGYAPGDYTIRCKDCGDIIDFTKMPIADKRAWRCKKHAEEALAAAEDLRAQVKAAEKAEREARIDGDETDRFEYGRNDMIGPFRKGRWVQDRDYRALLSERDAWASRVEELEAQRENAGQAMAETSPNWEARCHAIMTALEMDFGGYSEDVPEVGSWFEVKTRQQAKRIEELEAQVAASCCPDLTHSIPWDRDRGELILRVHHILTEPVCPTATLTWETSGETLCSASADTIEEAVAKVLAHDKLRAVMKEPTND